VASKITPEQEIRIETARVLVEQARQLMLGCPAEPIPAEIVTDAQETLRMAINKLRRCQAARMWKLGAVDDVSQEVALYGDMLKP
jgi:hypothetical protein